MAPPAIVSFQSTPHFSSEANLEMFLIGLNEVEVSIHASLQQRGERFSPMPGRMPNCFNPRLTSAARRTGNLSPTVGVGDVSIHASLQQRGEPRHVAENLCCRRFNPRLTSAARRTRLSSSRCILKTSFNPRLTSAARRTLSLSRMRSGALCFNPRLTSAARRTLPVFPSPDF